MTTNNFEDAWTISLALVSKDEGDNSWRVSSIVVRFPRFQIPLINFLNFYKIVGSEQFLHVIYSVEMWGASSQTLDDGLGVSFALVEDF